LSVSNAINGDSVNAASGFVTLAGAGVGLQSITDASTLVLGGVNASNYTVSGASGLVTITNSFAPFSITSSSVNLIGTNFVVCWQSVPGVAYNVLTSTNLLPPQTWTVAAGPITATNTTTCYTWPEAGIVTTNSWTNYWTNGSGVVHECSGTNVVTNVVMTTGSNMFVVIQQQ
jgi:hypothetical protein